MHCPCRNKHLLALLVCLSLRIFPSLLSSSFFSYLFTFLQLSVELLSSCLHIQVVSVAEYHRRIDALNSEELRTLCRRLQVPSSVVQTPSPATKTSFFVVSWIGASPALSGFVLSTALQGSSRKFLCFGCI